VGVRPKLELKKQVEELDKQIRRYVKEQLSKENTILDPFPEPILQQYDQNQTKIREIISILNTDEGPVWAQDVSDLNGPLPRLLGHYMLQRLLVLEIFKNIQLEKPAEADAAFR